MNKTEAFSVQQGRLISVDALRGFTMFWIIAGGAVFQSFVKISDNNFTRWLYNQLTHVKWEGFHFYDLIFPMFLFIIGVTLPYSYGKRLRADNNKWHLYRHILIRSLTLFALGLLCFGYTDPELRWEGEVLGYYGVLQLLAVASFFASLIMLNTSVRGMVIWAVSILAVYTMIMALIPVPGYGMGNFTDAGNVNTLVSKWVEQHIGIKWRWLLTPYMIPTVTTALIGILTGYWLQTEHTPVKKCRGLLLAGFVLVAAGLLLSLWFPIIKNLWNTSYVLFAGGLSLLFLAVFYWLIDIRQYKKWAFFFVVIGMNSITIYMLTHLISFGDIAYFITYGFNKNLGAWYDFVIAITSLAVQWFFLHYLYRHKIFIKL